MEKREFNNYLNALKSVKKNNVQIAQPKRKQTIDKQGGKCPKCKKTLKNYFSKRVIDPVTKEVSIICSDCAIQIPKRK